MKRHPGLVELANDLMAMVENSPPKELRERVDSVIDRWQRRWLHTVEQTSLFDYMVAMIVPSPASYRREQDLGAVRKLLIDTAHGSPWNGLVEWTDHGTQMLKIADDFVRAYVTHLRVVFLRSEPK